MGATNDNAIDVEDVEDAPVFLREESEEGLNLRDLPAADSPPSEDVHSLFVAEDEGPRRSKRPRTTTNTSSPPESSPESSPGFEPLPKRSKNTDRLPADEATDDKKKMAMDTSYDGFSIYGRVLCLVVKRKEKKGKEPARSGGQAMMEDWITSTQMPPQEEDG